jgi:hypothetical protein
MTRFAVAVAILAVSVAALPVRAQQAQSVMNGTYLSQQLNPSSQAASIIPAFVSNLGANIAATFNNFFGNNQAQVQAQAVQATAAGFPIVTMAQGAKSALNGPMAAPVVGQNGLGTTGYLSMFGYNTGAPQQ